MRLWFVLPFIAEIIVNFNMTYSEQGEPIIDRLVIVRQYLRKEFIWDLAGVICTVIVIDSENFLVVLIILMVRFVKFWFMYDSIEEKF